MKSADAANTYLKLSGGAMTGNIRYKGSKNTYDMITFVDNNADTYGNGICIGGGGLTIIGGGESASEALKQHTSGGDKNMIVGNDAAIDFFSNVQNGWNSRKAGSFDTSGYWNGVGFKKDNSSDSYVLLGGGGHKAISSLSVNYASSAGSASSVAWSNVSGRPTKLSQFTNDSGYITSSGSCAYATNADKVDGVHVTWAGELTSTNHLVAWEADGSALRNIKPANVTVGNSDKLDGIHANGLLTALSNSDKGISITVGGTTKSVSNISVNYANSAGYASKVYGKVGDTGSHELVRCDMSTDQFRIIAGSSGNNNGWAEIATGDAGNEPIYVRQYTGVFSSIKRTLTLLDANGHTLFPSYINIGGNENNNSSPDRVWGSNGSDSYLRSYRTGALKVAYASSAGNADTVDGIHANGLLTDLSNSNKGISITVGGTTKSVSNLSVVYANSATNADTVDGIHANGLLTALSNSNKGISITVGGTNKSVSNLSVNELS